MTAIVFLDTETTGLDHFRRRVWEIAMIRRDGGDQDELVLQVEDVDLADADPFGLKVGRFYERHARYARVSPAEQDFMLVKEERAARLVEEWTRGAHIVGAVPNFDEHSLREMLWRHGLLWNAHYHLVDVEALAVGYLHGYARGLETGLGDETSLPWDSEKLSRACGVEPAGEDERHTALGDARWAMRLYDAITSESRR